MPLKLKYVVELRCRPSMPDNVKYWKVFQDDCELKKFLEYLDEFFASIIDKDKDAGDVHSNNYIIAIKPFQYQFEKC